MGRTFCFAGTLRCGKGLSGLTADVHDNDVGTDFFDVFVRDDKLRPGVKQVEEFVAAGDDEGADLSAAFVELQIADFSQTFAVF